MTIDTNETIRIGNELLELKARCTYGEWMDQADSIYRLGQRQRQKYMKAAKNADLVRDKSFKSLNHIDAYIRQHRPVFTVPVYVYKPMLENANVIADLMVDHDIRSLEQFDIGRPMCGIYFLMSGENCVYVGKSTNLFARLAEHQRSEDKGYNQVMFQHVPEYDLNYMEVEHIHCLLPVLNGTGMTCAKPG